MRVDDEDLTIACSMPFREAIEYIASVLGIVVDVPATMKWPYEALQPRVVWLTGVVTGLVLSNAAKLCSDEERERRLEEAQEGALDDIFNEAMKD